MPYISAYLSSNSANIEPLSVKRDWMDETFDRHAYNCFPVSLANMLGWAISFPKDIEFSWDGISDSSQDHVKVHKGHEYVFTGRGNATISFRTGIFLKSEENISWLMMPVPNQFIEGVQCFTTIISTSVLKGEIPCAWRITTKDKKILIPAGTPISAFIPISIKNIESYVVNVYDSTDLGSKYFEDLQNYSTATSKKSQMNDWTHFYRNAVDHLGNKLGTHESKTVRLKLNDHRDLT